MPRNPTKDVFSSTFQIQECQFIADASRNLVVDVYGKDGRIYARKTYAITTTAQTFNELVTDPAERSIHSWWQVISVAGTIYVRPGSDTAVTSANGYSLAANDLIGCAPGMGPRIASVSPSIGSVSISGSVTVQDGGGSLTVDNNGTFAVQNNSTGKTLKTYSGTITSDTDIIAAVTAKRIKVYAYSIVTTDNTGDLVIFKSNGTAGTELWRVYLKGPDASTPFGANLATAVPGFLFATAAGEKLTADVSSGATLHLSVAYWDDDAS